MILKNVKIEDLAILNNLLLFINTSPALINPFLAIPSVLGMASNGGFNLTGYRIIDGVLDFDYHKNKKLLDITKLFNKILDFERINFPFVSICLFFA